MAYKFSFADNETYSASDINNITKRLVTGGIADPFTDGTAYNLTDINEMGTLFYTEGVVPESCTTLKVSVSGKTVEIYPGAAFFSDGAVIEVEAGGHTLSRTLGAVNYVYLQNDLVNTNTCYPVCSLTAPTGIYVPLAEIAADGTVTDKRTFAHGKLPGYGSNALHTMAIFDTVHIDGKEAGSKTYTLGNNSYRFLLAVAGGMAGSGGESNPCLGIYSFEDGTYLSFGGKSDFGSVFTDRLAVYRDPLSYGDATVTHSAVNGEQAITLDITWYSEKTLYEFPITLYLF